MRNLIPRFILGFKAPINGFKLIKNNTKLLHLSIAPFAISLVLVIIGLILAFEFSFGTFPMFLSFLFSPKTAILSSGIVATIAKLLLNVTTYIVISILWVFIMMILVNIICIPFHSLLAERTLKDLNALEQKPFSISNWLKTCARMFFISIIRTSVLLIIGLVPFLLSFFVPGLSILAGFIGLLIITSDCLDYSLEILEFDLKKRFSIFKKYFIEFTGFCCFFGIMPVINLLLLPVAVVGAAWLVVQLKINQEI